VPFPWKRRQIRIPRGLVLHYGLPPEESRTWHDCFPVTTPLQTVVDCQVAHLSPDLLEQARSEGITRGLFTASDLDEAFARRAVNS
jgi:hypothetical protein